MSWRTAKSLDVLLAEVNARWKGRSKASDGTKGDDAHAARTSDHNPNAAGVVRARDTTAKGIDAEWLFQHIIRLGKANHPALGNHAYVIYNGRAAYQSNGWKIVPYKGPNQHKTHVHTSVSRTASQYDSLTPWGIAQSTQVNILRLQQDLNKIRRTQRGKVIIVEDGLPGKQTSAAVKEFQRDYNELMSKSLLPVNGEPDPATVKAVKDLLNLLKLK